MYSLSFHAGETATFIQQSKEQLVEDIRRFYGVYLQGSEGLFDRFYGYLANSVHTGDVSDLPTEFTEVKN